MTGGKAPQFRIQVSTKGDRDPLKATAREINRAKKSVWAVVYKFDEFDGQPILDAVRRAVSKGRDVRLLVDKWLVTEKKTKKKKKKKKRYEQKSLVPEAEKAGAKIRRWDGGKLHVKFTIVDRSLALSGSYNWTESAAKGNTELLLGFKEPRIVNAFARRFSEMWRDATPWKPR